MQAKEKEKSLIQIADDRYQIADKNSEVKIWVGI
jgi:hypothetical protein